MPKEPIRHTVAQSADGNWICCAIEPKYLRSKASYDRLKEGLQRVFCGDYLDFATAGKEVGEEHYRSFTEHYVFVKVKDYHKYIGRIKRFKQVSFVLNSYDTPDFVPDSEVYKFINQHREDVKGRLRFGELVTVLRGKHSKLTGVAWKYVGQNKYRVFFRFYTKSFFLIIDRANLESKDEFIDLRMACEKIPSVKRNLQKQVACDKLKKVSDFKCDYCGKVLKSSIGLTLHKKVCKQKITCDVCGKVLKTTLGLRLHKEACKKKTKKRKPNETNLRRRQH